MPAPTALLDKLRERLEKLNQDSLRRELTIPEGVDFSSNDYLGLASDSAFSEAFERRRNQLSAEELLAPASRLLCGNREIHLHFEKRFAAFKGQAAGLLFPSGFQANLGLLSALLSPSDRVLSDELNHASLIDGLRLSRCQKVLFRHADIDHVRAVLARPHAGGRTFLVTESLFSMEGDAAPLAEYGALAEEGRLELIVDDAHATGLYGPGGAGLVTSAGIEDVVLATTSTLGKAFGLGGAVVTGSSTLVDYLVNHCRPFIFSTGVPPLLVAALEASLDVVLAEPQRRDKVQRLARHLREGLGNAGIPFLGKESPIVPVQIGDNDATILMAEKLRQQGFDIRAIRPPTVPEGTGRLRISVHASHTTAELDRLTETLVALFPRPAAARTTR